MCDLADIMKHAQEAGDAIRRDRTLHDLVAQYRRRAETAEATKRWHLGGGRAQAAERLEGKRQAYANCADDLERALREQDEPHSG